MQRRQPRSGGVFFWCLAGACAAGLLAGGCASGPGPKIPAEGAVGGARIAASVDAEVARYYLESYLRGSRARPEWDGQIDAAAERHRLALPTREDLARIATDFGSVDFAALFFAERLLADDCNRRLNESFARRLSRGPSSPRNAQGYRVLFVPGWEYVDNGALTGADFARPRQLATLHGLENALVPVASTGSVERNAQVIAAEIRRHAASGRALIVAGASSAGPAIHLALAEHVGPDERRAVRAWLNLAGILQGTPVLDWALEPPRSWVLPLVEAYMDWEREALWSMTMARSRPRFARLRLDPAILVVNYLGVPVSGSVGAFAEDKYRLLRPLGPNDGLTLLPDALVPGGATIVALGRDHFLAQDPHIDARTVALMELVVAALETGGRCGD